LHLGKAEVCSPSPDPPQESTALAVGEGVPQGEGTRAVICRIHVTFLQKDLPLRENPQKTGGLRPSGTLLFILFFGKTDGMDIRTFSKDGDLEFYQKEHFIAMTGDGAGFYRLESFDTPEMKELLSRKCEKREEWKGACKGVNGLSTMTDRDVVEKRRTQRTEINSKDFMRAKNCRTITRTRICR